MSEQETVEMETVTIKVAKDLMRVLEELNYFGYTKEQFFINAVKSRISCELCETDYGELDKIHEKYPWLEDAVTT